MTKEAEKVIVEQPSYFGIIPATVRYNKKISPNAKLLYSELTALADKHGYCFATNEYFAAIYEKDDKTISRWVSSLRDEGYIHIEYIRRGCEVKERRIYICGVPKMSPKGQKEHSTGDEKRTPSGDEKRTDSITSISSTSKDIKSLSPDGDQPQPPAVVTKSKSESLHHQTIDFISRVHHKVHGSPVAIDPKEAAHVRQIIKLAEAEDPDNPKAVIERRLRICLRKMETATTDYWADFKFTPSKIRSRWNELTPDLPKMTNAEKAIRENELRVNDIPAPEAVDSVEEKNRRELLAMFEEAESNVTA